MQHMHQCVYHALVQLPVQKSTDHEGSNESGHEGHESGHEAREAMGEEIHGVRVCSRAFSLRSKFRSFRPKTQPLRPNAPDI